MIEISLVLLLILIAVLFFILMSLFFYLIIKKYFNNRTTKKMNDYKEEYQLDVFRFLQTGAEGLLPTVHDHEKFKVVIELMIDYSTILDDSYIQERISSFAKQHLTTYVKKELRKKRWSLRMNALYLIEDFYMDYLGEVLHELFNKKRTTVPEKIQILKLLAKFNDHKMIEYLKTISNELSDFSLLSIIMCMQEDKFDELTAEVDGLSTGLQYMVVERIGKKQLFKHQHLLEKLILQEDEELRIRALKAYAATGFPIDAKAITGFFNSKSWQIRMMVTKVAGVQRLEEYKDQLIELLSDQEYLVRTEAAKAILRFKDGIELLTRVTEDSKDLFAKDMAIEWLEKERESYSY
ncbi:HEAT repeat domain-containing protein [Ureibacillus sp. NPDC094379]